MCACIQLALCEWVTSHYAIHFTDKSQLNTIVMYHIQLIHLRLIILCVTSGLLLHPPGAATELTAMVPVAFTVLAVLVGLLLLVVVGVVIPVVCTRLCIQRRRKNAYYSMWALHRTPYTYNILLCICLLYTLIAWCKDAIFYQVVYICYIYYMHQHKAI